MLVLSGCVIDCVLLILLLLNILKESCGAEGTGSFTWEECPSFRRPCLHLIPPCTCLELSLVPLQVRSSLARLCISYFDSLLFIDQCSLNRLNKKRRRGRGASARAGVNVNLHLLCLLQLSFCTDCPYHSPTRLNKRQRRGD